MTVADVLAALQARLVDSERGFRVIPTGFSPLDEMIGGGFRSGDLVLLAGSQGTGKTTMALQMARNIAISDLAGCLYLSYEHDEINLLSRLLAMESSAPEHRGDQGLTLREVLHLLVAASRRGVASLADLGEQEPRLAEVLDRLDLYRDNLLLLRASARATSATVIAELVDDAQQRLGRPMVLFVDYLQKVPAEKEFLSEGDRITWVTEALNELCIGRSLSVMAIAALDQEGLRAKRLRVHHLWGGSSLAYEADVILMLTEKAEAIARVHYEFNPQKIAIFREWVVASLVKNRSGRNLIDLEFRKRFAHSCFDANGGFVTEKLIDEQAYRD